LWRAIEPTSQRGINPHVIAWPAVLDFGQWAHIHAGTKYGRNLFFLFRFVGAVLEGPINICTLAL
jgi:hypothetical protein